MASNNIRLCKAAKASIILSVLQIVTRNCEGSLKVIPVNETAIREGTARFNCSTNSTETNIQWQYQPDGDLTPNIIYNGSHIRSMYTEQYSVEKDESSGRCDLVVKLIQVSDAGPYSCVDDNGNGQRATAFLTVDENLPSPLVRPVDTVAVRGFDVSLNCTSCCKDTLNWEFQQDGSVIFYGNHGLMNGYRTSGRHFIDSDDSIGRYDLIIKSVNSSDAGVYICNDEAGVGKETHARLYVLDSEMLKIVEKTPSCYGNLSSDGVLVRNTCGMKPDLIMLTCRIEYIGSEAPPVMWVNATDGNPIENSTCDRTMYTTTCQTFVVASNDTNWSEYVCRIGNSLTCKPTYNKTKSIYVLHNPVKLNSQRVLDSISCTVASSQNCEYKWQKIVDLHNITVSHDQVLHPTGPGRYECTAQCRIRDVPCILNPVSLNLSYDLCVPCTHSGEYSTSLIIVTIASVITTTFVIVCAVVYSVLKRRAKTGIHQMRTTYYHLADSYYKRTKVQIGCSMNIGGFAVFERKLFIILRNENKILVFNDQKPYNFLSEFEVNRLDDPTNIYTGHGGHQLFVTGISDSQGIENYWKIKTSKPTFKKEIFSADHLVVLENDNLNSKYKLSLTPGGKVRHVQRDEDNHPSGSSDIIVTVGNPQDEKGQNSPNAETSNTELNNPENWFITTVTVKDTDIICVLNLLHKNITIVEDRSHTKILGISSLCDNKYVRQLCYNNRTQKFLLATRNGCLQEISYPLNAKERTIIPIEEEERKLIDNEHGKVAEETV